MWICFTLSLRKMGTDEGLDYHHTVWSTPIHIAGGTLYSTVYDAKYSWTGAY
jgi:hypothetical protein